MPLNLPWYMIVDWYNHVIKEKEMTVRGFNSAGVSEAVQNAKKREWFFILVKLLIFFPKYLF